MLTKSYDSYAQRCDRLNNLFLAVALLVIILAVGMIYMDSNHSLFTQNPQIPLASSVSAPTRWVDAVTPRSDSSRIGRVSLSEIDENLEVSLGAQRASFRAAMALAKAARQ